LAPQTHKPLIIKKKQEVRREPFAITPYCPFQYFGFYAIELREIRIQHYFLSPDKIDNALNFFSGSRNLMFNLLTHHYFPLSAFGLHRYFILDIKGDVGSKTTYGIALIQTPLGKCQTIQR